MLAEEYRQEGLARAEKREKPVLDDRLVSLTVAHGSMMQGRVEARGRRVGGVLIYSNVQLNSYGCTHGKHPCH